MDMSLNKLQERVKDRRAWRAAVLGVTEADKPERRNNNSKEHPHQILTAANHAEMSEASNRDRSLTPLFCRKP